jgi:hypothetical protein
VKLQYLLLLCALPAQALAACAFDTNLQPFRGAATAFVDTTAVQVPEVEDVSFTRGLAGGASCDQLGFLTIKLRWPRGPHDLEDVGFEYRVVNGEAPEDLLPEGLVVAPVRGRRTEHQLTWNDGAPGEQRPLRLLLEVRAVTSDGLRGPPAQVRVGAP